MWDMQSASGMTLINTQSIINTYAQKTGTSVDMLMSNLKKIDTNTITTESRAIFEKLLK
jgi:hypothetical protein